MGEVVNDFFGNSLALKFPVHFVCVLDNVVSVRVLDHRINIFTDSFHNFCNCFFVTLDFFHKTFENTNTMRIFTQADEVFLEFREEIYEIQGIKGLDDFLDQVGGIRVFTEKDKIFVEGLADDMTLLWSCNDGDKGL